MSNYPDNKIMQENDNTLNFRAKTSGPKLYFKLKSYFQQLHFDAKTNL